MDSVAGSTHRSAHARAAAASAGHGQLLRREASASHARQGELADDAAMATSRKTVVVVGGGFFGMYVAEYCASLGHHTLLIEREQEFMRRSSYNNQARIHNGYHYPRSILTALRSRVSFPRFVSEFRECVHSEFEKYYLIGSPLSKVSASQFRKFCERIGASCDTAPDRIRRLTNPHFVEACFSTVEYAFDATALRKTMLHRIEAASVNWRLGVTAERIERKTDHLLLTLRGATRPSRRSKRITSSTAPIPISTICWQPPRSLRSP